MNAPFHRGQGAGPKTIVFFTLPRLTVLLFGAALVLNATTTLLLATAFVTHLLVAGHH